MGLRNITFYLLHRQLLLCSVTHYFRLILFLIVMPCIKLRLIRIFVLLIDYIVCYSELILSFVPAPWFAYFCVIMNLEPIHMKFTIVKKWRHVVHASYCVFSRLRSVASEYNKQYTFGTEDIFGYVGYVRKLIRFYFNTINKLSCVNFTYLLGFYIKDKKQYIYV